jgi:hypothetical protein
MVVLRLNTLLTPKPASVLVIDAVKYQTLLQNLTGGAGGGHGGDGVKVFSTFARTEENQKLSLRALTTCPAEGSKGVPNWSDAACMECLQPSRHNDAASDDTGGRRPMEEQVLGRAVGRWA